MKANAKPRFWDSWDWWLIAVVVYVLICDIGRDHDATDPPDRRSGLSLYTDHGTGCQYVAAGFFGELTPRLGADGKPICEPPAKIELKP